MRRAVIVVAVTGALLAVWGIVWGTAQAKVPPFEIDIPDRPVAEEPTDMVIHFDSVPSDFPITELEQLLAAVPVSRFAGRPVGDTGIHPAVRIGREGTAIAEFTFPAAGEWVIVSFPHSQQPAPAGYPSNTTIGVVSPARWWAGAPALAVLAAVLGALTERGRDSVSERLHRARDDA